MTFQKVKKELRTLADKNKAKVLQRFFKTGSGEYAEGDVFLGVVVPKIRAVAKAHQYLTCQEIFSLLKSPFHEERLLSLLMLVQKFIVADEDEKKFLYENYLKNTKYINNWDLVDLSAQHIVGAYLADKKRGPLYTLAKSPVLWERRIAILATFYFIKKYQFDDTLNVVKMLLEDENDLIHKAGGWLLREVGKRDTPVLEDFLKKYYHRMPRTMLRYAIEKFPENKRKAYLKGRV